MPATHTQQRNDARSAPGASRASDTASRLLLAGLIAASVALFFGVAIYLYFVVEMRVGDAWSRTANGMLILFSRDPHIAAVGFVWNPAPSILQLPLILALWPFHLPLFSGPVFSVITAAAMK